MAYRLAITRQADSDADAAYEWMAKQSLSRAAKWYRGLLQAIESLRENPLLHGFAPEREALKIDLRQMLYGKRRNVFRILYTVDDDTVVVLHIRHAARRLLEE
jgi:plasmid stabilization system protein ParE